MNKAVIEVKVKNGKNSERIHKLYLGLVSKKTYWFYIVENKSFTAYKSQVLYVGV